MQYRLLGNSGLRVSEAALGTMTFGDDWGWGAFSDLGKIDVIVNNAGYGLFGAAEELNDAQIAHQVSNKGGPEGFLDSMAQELAPFKHSRHHRGARRRPHQFPVRRGAAWHADGGLSRYSGRYGSRDD